MIEYKSYYYAFLGPIFIAEGSAAYVYEKALEYCYKYSFNIQQIEFQKEFSEDSGAYDKIPIDKMRKLVYKNDH